MLLSSTQASHVRHGDESCALCLLAKAENGFEFGARFGFHQTKWFRNSLNSICFVMVICTSSFRYSSHSSCKEA